VISGILVYATDSFCPFPYAVQCLFLSPIPVGIKVSKIVPGRLAPGRHLWAQQRPPLAG